MCKNIFIYVKTWYVEVILAKIGKLEKTMIRYLSDNKLDFTTSSHPNPQVPLFLSESAYFNRQA